MIFRGHVQEVIGDAAGVLHEVRVQPLGMFLLEQTHTQISSRGVSRGDITVGKM